MNREPPRKKRRKRGVRLTVAYALQALIILLMLTVVTLLICGILYVREHLFPQSVGGTALSQGLVGDEPGPLQGLAGDKSKKVVGVEPSVDVSDEKTVVVLDAGHGGIQAGCEFDGVLEKDITLAVTLLARDKLEDKGVTVIMTREEDIDVSLDERCQIANDADADLFVSIHCNSYTEDTSINGFEGYYHDDAKGERLAQYILDAAGTLSVTTRHVRDENYKVLRDTAMPAALMEIGFLSNPSEREWLQTVEYQDTIAQAVADGVLEMLKSR